MRSMPILTQGGDFFWIYGHMVGMVCANLFWYARFPKLCMPNYSGTGTKSYFKVCGVCEVCLF